MEVKKIVEGMTALKVAQVIDDNFNEIDKEKANKVDVKSLDLYTSPIIDSVSYDQQIVENEGKYVSASGYLGTSEGFAYTDPFDLPAKKTVVVKARGYLTNVCIIARYDGESSYKPLVNSIDNQERVYVYTNNSEETIRIICSFSTGFNRKVRISDIATKEELYDLFVGKPMLQKTSMITGKGNVGILQNGVLAFDLYVQDEFTNKFKFELTNVGYYAANNFVGVQGKMTEISSGLRYQYTIRVDEATTPPKGINTYKTESRITVYPAGHSGEGFKIDVGLLISINFDIIVGFSEIMCEIKPYNYSSFSQSYSTVKRVEEVFEKTKQISYPYIIGEVNTISENIEAGLNSGIKKDVILNNEGNELEKKALRLEITRTTTLDWSYYWTKNCGIRQPGKYLGFMRVKKNGNSPFSMTIFTNGGSVIAQKDMTNDLTSSYQLVFLEFELTEEKQIMIGFSARAVGSLAEIGEIVEISLIGVAKDRTESSLGSDIYTIDDLKNYFIQSSYGKTSNIEEIATMGIFEGIPVVGIIGDSLSSGVSYNGTNLVTDYNFAWWRVLERDSGQKYIPFAKGGLTTRSWISDYLSESLKLENKCCVYVLALQVNDVYSLGESYLGTSEDIDVSNYNNNADSYYGNYAKIVQALTENNPKCKFFLLTDPRKTGESDSKWNGAVRYIASLFSNCYLVDMQGLFNSLYLSGFIADVKSNDAHYPSIGYSYMGKLIEKAIGEVIKENANDFKYIQFALD